MSDNITLSLGSEDGPDIATDDITDVHYPISKLAHGALDSATLVSTSSGLPVQQQGTWAVNLGAVDNAVLDDIAAQLALVVGHVDGLEGLLGDAATETTLAGVLADTAAIEVATEAIQAAVEGTLTISGTVELGATDNAVLDAIAASVAAIDTDATTLIGHVDGLEGLLTTIDGDTGNIATEIAALSHAEDAAHQSGDAGVMLLGVRQSTQADFGADGDYVPLSINDDGAVRVEASLDTTGLATEAKQDTLIGHVDGIETLLGGTLTVDASGAAVPVTDNGSTLSIDDGGGVITVDGTVAVTHAALTELGAAINGSAQMDVNIAASGATVPVSHAALTELAAAIDTEMQVDVVGALPAGTNAIGNVGLIPRTSGGMSIFRSIDIDESEEEIKGTAGQVFSITAFNRTAAPLYLKFYNATAANVTVGTTTPVLTFVVPANADSDGAGFVWNNEIGFAFGTAITVACTTGVADNDTGAPGANDCVINVGFA